ncbi:hypothetical protein FQZ97_342480 [compost metagenome]
MLLREDFQKAIESSVARYPAVAALVKAGDPRILQHLDAMATMLAMYSAQLEVASAEPFEKTRDSTVLADAAMRGLVPKSSPARLKIAVFNGGSSSFRIEQGRMLMDVGGRLVRVEAPVDVPPGGVEHAEALQLYSKTTTHAVVDSRPFYEVEIGLADDDSALCGVSVSDGAGVYEYRERYVNTLEGERVYHIEADERRRVYVRFGQDGVVGTQPIDGTLITITAFYSMGDVEFKAGSPMVFETMGGPEEALVEMHLDAVLEGGQSPLDMRTLRELAKYPSVYNHNAVFLGEFDFLVRRHFPSLRFLSVWNEGAEEAVRGMSVDNINALFVACLSGSGDEPVLFQPAGQTVAPQVVTDLTATQQSIRARILAADDSYRVRFYTPVRSEVAMTVRAKVASSYEESIVREQIRKVLLDNFGAEAPQSRRGLSAPLYQQVYQVLRQGVPALAVGRADLRVDIEDVGETVERPELWRYVSPDSLAVGVTTTNVATPYWGAGF